MHICISQVKVTGTHQVIKDTLVEPPLKGAALPQLVVVVVEALPVVGELLKAVLVDVLDTVCPALSACPVEQSELCRASYISMGLFADFNVHAGSAASNTAALLQALELAAAGVLVLALHVVIVIVAAASADEVGCG